MAKYFLKDINGLNFVILLRFKTEITNNDAGMQLNTTVSLSSLVSNR